MKTFRRRSEWIRELPRPQPFARRLTPPRDGEENFGNRLRSGVLHFTFGRLCSGSVAIAATASEESAFGFTVWRLSLPIVPRESLPSGDRAKGASF